MTLRHMRRFYRSTRVGAGLLMAAALLALAGCASKTDPLGEQGAPFPVIGEQPSDRPTHLKSAEEREAELAKLEKLADTHGDQASREIEGRR